MTPPRRPPQRPPRPRQHRNGNANRARIGLVIVFALLRIVDVFFILALPTVTKPALAAIILVAMWTTALLIAVWRRQQWARIILLGVFTVATITAMVLIPAYSEKSELVTALIAAGLVAIGSSAWLIYSRDVRRLTSRDRE